MNAYEIESGNGEKRRKFTFPLLRESNVKLRLFQKHKFNFVKFCVKANFALINK